VECADPVLAGGREVAADRQEPLSAGGGAPAAGDFLLELDHADVLLGLVVAKRHPEVVSEAQHVGLIALYYGARQIVRCNTVLTVLGGVGGIMVV